MSTDAPKNKLWFVYAPDYTDADAQNRRMKVREEHLAAADPNIQSGWSRVAGPLFEPESFEAGGPRKFLGSAFIVEAPTYKEVKDRMENDIYWKENVWDKEKMVISGFFSATQYPSNP